MLSQWNVSKLLFGFAALSVTVVVNGQGVPARVTQTSRQMSLPEEEGKRIFTQQCAACHNVVKGAPNKLGPTLANLVGARAGTRPGFDYSPAFKQANFRWSDARLEAFFANPSTAVPGNRMPFAGIASADSRRKLIAYLKATAR
ncbi:MAG: c-type cytochrome [Hyphomicrobiales bacterium]|nr:c-type cytochrome [Hyphomicrobiales bacterium]